MKLLRPCGLLFPWSEIQGWRSLLDYVEVPKAGHECYCAQAMTYDLQTDDLSKATNDELFAGIEGFCAAQPIEGWRHDYTEI